MKKTTIKVMIITIIAKILGFIRDKVVLNFFGTGPVTEAFTLAYGIPSTLLAVVVTALVTGFIPMYTRVKQNDDENSNDFTNNVFNILVMFGFVLGLIMFLFPEVIVKLAAAGFNEETHMLASTFVRIISFSALTVSIMQLGVGYLNVNQSFILPAAISLPSNIVIIIFTLLAKKTGEINLIAWGTLAAFAVQGILMFSYMKVFKFKYKPEVNFKDPYLKEMVRLAMPLLYSSLLGTLNSLAITSYATTIYGQGAYAYISMSGRLLGFATGIFVTGVLSVAYPTVASAAAKDDKVGAVNSMNDAILLIVLFIFPVVVGFITMRYEIVAFVYGCGKIGVTELEILSSVFLGSTLGLFFLGIRDLYIRVHYAYQDMKTPLHNQILYVVSNVALFLILGKFFGLFGITLAGSIAAGFSTIFLFNSLLNRFKRLGMRVILRDIVKITIASIAMGVAVMGLKFVLSAWLGSRLITILIIGLAGIVYLGFILLLKVDVVFSLLKRKTH